MSNEAKSEVKKEMKIDPAYQGYVFLGWASGLFELRSGEKRPYYNMYVFSPVSSYVSEDYEASGFKAEKKKCISPNVWAGHEPRRQGPALLRRQGPCDRGGAGGLSKYLVIPGMS